MAAIHGLTTEVWLGGYDVGTYFNSANVPSERDEVDATGFGATGKSTVLGLKNGRVELGGFFYGGTGEIDEQLEGYFSGSAAVPFTIMYGGDTLGNPARVANLRQTQYTIGTNISDVAKVTASGTAQGGAPRALVLHPKGAETATDTETGVDWGALSTASSGFAATLHIFAISGGITVTCKIADSADNVTFADVTGGAFTAATTVGSQYLTGTASVRRYTRAAWTITGTGSVTFGIALAKKL